MIIGRGLIASLFHDNDSNDIIFFASGVSNSSETDEKQFLREEKLIYETLESAQDKLFIYFSTCSIYDSSKTESFYVLHKLKMEEIIKQKADKFLILRVSNAVGKGGNPNLLLNYIIRSVISNQQINVHTKATRNIIDVEDIRKLTLEIIDSNNYNRIINIAYPYNFSIVEILEIAERYYDKELNLNLVKSGESYNISISDIEQYFLTNQLMDKEKYLQNIFEKYY